MPAGSFPLASLPPAKWSWRTGMRAFGANRSNGRAHAGSDLYAPAGTAVHAVAAGTVSRAPYYFYNGTYAVEITHPGIGTVRYGEIAPGCTLGVGQRVARGERIARVGHLEGITVPSDMLHFELFLGTSVGPLTTSAAAGRRHTNGRPFLRRRDVVDPAPYLDAWAKSLPGMDGSRGTVRLGSRGVDVEALQRALRAAGEYSGAIDGDAGPKTITALKAWQSKHKLTADGIAGKGTWAALDAAGL